MELQTRLEIFKRDFNTFYARALRSYGKWRNNSATPSVGSVVYILDKATPKLNFLQKFAVGRITKYLSDHTVEVAYVKQSPEATQGLIGSIRTGLAPAFGLKTCTCDLRSLGLLVDPLEDSAWARGVDIDQLLVTEAVDPEPIAPVETDPATTEANPLEANKEEINNAANADPKNTLDNEFNGEAILDEADTTNGARTIPGEATKRPQRKRVYRVPHWHQ